MKTKNYLLVKSGINKEIIYIDYNKLDGFRIKPQNKVQYEGIEVNKMIIIKQSFIEKMLKKKIKRKLDAYLQYIISLIENNADDDPSNLRGVLDDVERYKSLIKNNYQRYLEDKYCELLLKKIALLEQELKNKIYTLRVKNYKKYEDKNIEPEEKSRKSR